MINPQSQVNQSMNLRSHQDIASSKGNQEVALEPIDQELVRAIHEEEKKERVDSDGDKFDQQLNHQIQDHRDSMAFKPAQEIDEPAEEVEQDLDRNRLGKASTTSFHMPLDDSSDDDNKFQVDDNPPENANPVEGSGQEEQKAG